MNTNTFFRAFLLAVSVISIASCDKDFNEIGSGIVGDDHFGIKDTSVTVTAQDMRFGPVQTNKTTSSTINVPINALGYYNNAVFGKTKASFVTQVELVSSNPTFNPNPVVKKVELTIPYFIKSNKTETNDDGSHTYVLDSLKGSSKIKLGVYESTYYLRDLDPSSNLTEQQKYYSNQAGTFDTYHNPTRLNDSIAPSQNDEFFFDPAEIVTYKTVDGVQQVDERLTPRMRLSLNKQFFQDKIFGPSAEGKLVNDNVFRDYFRGLYFKAENAASSPDQGTLAMLNFKQGKITVTYEVDTSESDDTRVTKTFVLNLTGNTVNVFENEENPVYTSAVTTADAGGDERLYLKGGEGSMAVIDLFGPGELEEIRAKGWQVNEANLTFWIDQEKMQNGEVPEPNRIYLYDLDNHRPLLDYFTDVTTFSSNPKFNKYVHGGILERELVPGTTDKYRGVRYKIKLTNHIRNLVNASIDSTNVRLGLVVTESISSTSNAALKTPNAVTDRVPAAAVANPLGTVIYGTNPAVPEEKRLKLEIYYTKERD